MRNSYQYVEFEKNNQAMLYIIWCTVGLMIFVEILNYVIYQFVDYTFVIENYIFKYIITPSIFHFLIGGACTLLYKKFNGQKPLMTSYFMILGFTALIQEVITIHYGVSVIYMAYALPIFLSILFNNKKITIVIGLVCITMYVLIYTIYLPAMPAHTYKHDFMDFTSTLVFLTGCFIVSIFIMNAFNRLIQKIIDADCEKVTLEQELMLDSFTKLYNKATFNSLLQKFFHDYKMGGSIFSVLVIDIDDFKKVNDTYGHAFGDKVILALVSAIKNNIRSTDYAFRYGGEEFTVILPTNQAYAVADKIRESFNHMSVEEHEDLRFSISIGLCEMNQSYLDCGTLFADADKALYDAKHSGKNKVSITTKTECLT